MIEGVMTMFINKYMSSHKKEIVTEGWGYIISAMAFVGIIANPIASQMNINKIVNHPKIKKYILSEADKLYKKAVKTHPTCDVIKDVTNFRPESFNFEDNRTTGSFMDGLVRGLGASYSQTKLGPYLIMAINDTDHVRTIQVAFGLQPKKQGAEKSRMVAYSIVAPNKGDVFTAGFRDTIN